MSDEIKKLITSHDYSETEQGNFEKQKSAMTANDSPQKILPTPTGASDNLIPHLNDQRTSNNAGATPLILAAKKGIWPLVLLFLIRDADDSIEDATGQSLKKIIENILNPLKALFGTITDEEKLENFKKQLIQIQNKPSLSEICLVLLINKITNTSCSFENFFEFLQKNHPLHFLFKEIDEKLDLFLIQRSSAHNINSFFSSSFSSSSSSSSSSLSLSHH